MRITAYFAMMNCIEQVRISWVRQFHTGASTLLTLRIQDTSLLFSSRFLIRLTSSSLCRKCCTWSSSSTSHWYLFGKERTQSRGQNSQNSQSVVVSLATRSLAAFSPQSFRLEKVTILFKMNWHYQLLMPLLKLLLANEIILLEHR